MDWDTACTDWEARLLEGRSLIPELPLIDAEADKALRIFKRLKVPDLHGNPTYGEVCRPWVFDLVRVIFGSWDPDVKRRYIREFFILVPKKNGKSAIAAAIIVTAAIMNRRPEAELLLIAPTKLIADIAYKQAAGIIRVDPELRKLFAERGHLRQIEHRLTLAVISIKAADTDVITGGKATFTLIDETHVFAKKPKAAEVFVELRGALASRPEGFLLQITTQSKEPPAGAFKAELHTARDVRDGKVRLPLLAVLYELPEAVRTDWRDRRYWGLVNPNLNASVDEAFLADELTKAERDGMHAVALFASQHFNVEVGVGLRTDAWKGAKYWERATDETLTLDEMFDLCEVMVLGLDGGGLDDLFGVALLGRKRDTRTWLSWSHAWCHEGVLEERKSIASRLRDFEAAGELTIIDDAFEDVASDVSLVGDFSELLLPKDHAGIVRVAVRIRDAGLLGGVAVDVEGPYGELIDALAMVGITDDDDQLVGIGQGYRLMHAIKACERKVANGTLRHCPSALMDWCVGNVKIEQQATSIRATKQNAGDAKIDPVMALFDAAVVMLRNPQPISTGRSYLEEEDLIVI